MEERVICTNRKLFRDYEVLDTFECGIALKGSEVKSLREARANIDDSFARPEGREVLLYHCHITPYEKASYFKEEATRPRRLLLHRSQINRLIMAVQQRGCSLAPMKMYFNRKGFVKVALSLVKGRKAYDKRQEIKRKETERDMRKIIKNRRQN